MRYTSQGCNCSFSYDITCPQLKVPNQPLITNPANATVLPCQVLNQCGNAIWAFGDTLSAVNGIITGADSSLDAACTHACCFTRCTPCIQYNLCTCPEVYQDPGIYYHRIRYVTASYEVSDFSDAACFCIGMACYDHCANCCIGYNENTATVCAVTTGTDEVTKCIIVDVSLDSDFSTIKNSVTCAGSCINTRSAINVSFGLNPDSNGEFLSANQVFYTRVCNIGGYDCDFTTLREKKSHCVTGNLYVFALCSGVSSSADNEGCCCIQLYATYTSSNNYSLIPTQGICYKFEVSPFSDFCSDVVTCTGPYNVFIPKCALGGAGACANYYVRTCVNGNTTAPQVVRCVNLGNVTFTNICGETDNCQNSCGRVCAGTINWNGPIVAFGIGAGGVGSACLAACLGCGIVTCGSGGCPNHNNICQIAQQLSGGQSGCIRLWELGSGYCGCCFYMCAGHSNCGSLRSALCSTGCESVFTICGSTNITCTTLNSSTGGGATGSRSDPFTLMGCCLPLRCYIITNIHGTSGNLLCLDNETTQCSAAPLVYRGCNVRPCSAATNDKATLFEQINDIVAFQGYYVSQNFATRPLSHFCDGANESAMIGGCAGNWCLFNTTDETNCVCTKIRAPQGLTCGYGLNWIGLGGFGGIICAQASLGWCGCGQPMVVCNPTRGFGFGAGGPSYSNCTLETWVHFCCNHCNGVNGQRGVSDCELGNAWWPAGHCGGANYVNNIWAGRWQHGGSGGMIFMCNHRFATCDHCLWQSRPGLMTFACQDYA